MSITTDQWNRAIDKAEDVLDEHSAMVSFQDSFETDYIELLLLRYRNGDRSEELYSCLIKVE